MSIILPIDYHTDELPPSPLDASWLAQIPREIAEEHPPKLVLLEGWREGPRKDVGNDALRQMAPKEMRRIQFSGAAEDQILESVARFWMAIETYLDRERPAAMLLWNCGNADQNLWVMLAGERHIPVMHCEHGWLPQTRIFDPLGGYVTGRSGWDVQTCPPAAALVGAAIIRLWRRARQSKHPQGNRHSERVQEFSAKGPALLVAMQLEADGAAVYNEMQFDCQRDFLRKCLTWPGPVLVKAHPNAPGIEWEPPFAEQRRLCKMEVEAKGGMWLDANESLHDLLAIVTAVAAINSNVLFEAAMAGKAVYSFGEGPHFARGFTVEMGAGDSWQVGEQTPEQSAAVCRYVGCMEAYLFPEGAWLPGWDDTKFWGYPFWEYAPQLLQERWESLST